MNRARTTKALTALAAVLWAMAARPADAPPAPRLLGDIGTFGETDAIAPNLSAGPDGRVHLTWVDQYGRAARLASVAREPGGSWKGHTLLAAGEGWFVNWADVPSMAVGDDGRVFAQWLVEVGPARHAYSIAVAAGEAGQQLQHPQTPHRDGSASEHGFVSFFPAPGAAMGLAWLDGRDTVNTAPGGARGATRLMATTLDAQARPGPEVVLDERVCDCCPTAAVRTPHGALVAYRDRSPGEVRDISVVRLVDGRWTKPMGVGSDGWKITGCPVNGPALAAQGAQVALAWYTAADEKPRVHLSFSSDAGATFSTPVRVDDGSPLGRVDVAALPGGDALVSWLEGLGEKAAGQAELRVRRVSRAGGRSAALTVARVPSGRASGIPRLELSGGEAVVAWRDTTVQPARIRSAVIAYDAATASRPAAPAGAPSAAPR